LIVDGMKAETNIMKQSLSSLDKSKTLLTVVEMSFGLACA